jgi:subtilisin family serine protease
MSGPRVRFLVVLSAFALTVYGQSRAPVQTPVSLPKGDAYVADHVLVKPRSGADVGALAAQHAAIGARVRQAFAAIGGLQVVQLPGQASVEAAIELYRRSGLVEYAEPDYIVHVAQAQNLPNDLSPNLWGLHNTGQTGGTADADIDAPEAWTNAFSSTSVIVGVVDTGVDYDHPDLNANMWRNPGETESDEVERVEGRRQSGGYGDGKSADGAMVSEQQSRLVDGEPDERRQQWHCHDDGGGKFYEKTAECGCEYRRQDG